MKMRMTVLALVMALTPQMRATIHRAFRADDFEIVWAKSPSEAMAASTTRRPGLVIMDVGLSAQSGREILEDLRLLNPTTPIVVLAERPLSSAQANADTGIAVLRAPVGAVALADTAEALLKVSGTASVPPFAQDQAQFREALRLRYDTPIPFGQPYRQWGINE